MKRLTITRKKIILLVLAIVIVLLINWVYSRSIIELNFGNGGEEVTYTIYNQSNKSLDTYTTNSSSVRKVVTTGTYEVTVNKKDGSYFEVITTGSFFSIYNITVNLSGEKNRIIVGENPRQCMSYNNSRMILFSWTCQGSLNTGYIHIPASSASPGYNQPLRSNQKSQSNNTPNPTSTAESLIPLSSSDIIEDQINIKGADFILVKSRGAFTPVHKIYPIDTAKGNVMIPSGFTLLDLESSKDYRTISYKEGALIYSSDGDQLFFYSDIKSSPTIIPIDAPSDERIKLYSIDTINDNILLTYTSHVVPEHNGASRILDGNFGARIHNESRADKEFLDRTELVLISNNKSITRSLSYNAKQVRLCGDNLLCVLKDQELRIYTMNEQSIDYLYSIQKVLQFETQDNNVYATKEDGIIVLQPKNRKGSYAYLFEEYNFCGLKKSGEILLLCVGYKNKEYALVLENLDIKEPIDKQLIELLNINEIKNVSISGNIIYIVPDYGNLSFVPATEIYDYDPQIKIPVNQIIRSKIQSIGLNESLYSIINTGE